MQVSWSRLLLVALVVAVVSLSVPAAHAADKFVTVSGDQLVIDGHVCKFKGTNYYPQYYMWASMWSVDLGTVQTDADRIKSLGMNCVRILVPYANGGWNAPNVPADRLQKLEDIINIFGQRGIRSCVTLFDWETSFAASTDSRWYNDHISYIRQVVTRLKDNKNVFMWDVKNEPDHPGNLRGDLLDQGIVVDSWNDSRVPSATKSKIVDWLRRACNTVRSYDTNHPVAAGLRWYQNVPDVVSFVDIAICHTYYPAWPHPLDEIAYVRNYTSKPLLFEEFGLPSAVTWNESQQYNCYVAHLEAMDADNISGGIQWMTYDGGNPDSSQEAHFGLWRTNLTLKPAGEYYRDHYLVYPFPTGDTTPPATPGVAAMASAGKVRLTWTNPTDSDVRGIVVRYGTSGYPTTPTDGTLVCDRNARPGSADLFDHVVPGTGVHYYTVFAYDTSLNYSAPVQVFANYTPASVYTTGAARLSLDQTVASIPGAVVTAAFPSENCIYVEDVNRTAGIRVTCPIGSLKAGDVVDVYGPVLTLAANGVPSERQISGAIVTKKASGNPLAPLALNCASVGGAPIAAGLPGIPGATGLNNFGLLVKVYGRAARVDGAVIYVEDGSKFSNNDGLPGVKVKLPAATSIQVGDVISVVGVVQGDVPTGANANRRCISAASVNDAATLRLKASVVGKVKNAWSEVIPGAAISTMPGAYTATSLTDGSYAIVNMNPGTYSVTASATGYQARSISGVSAQDGARTTLDITLLSGKGRISGVVRDLRSNPVSGASVSGGGKYATTGADGKYTLLDVAPGTVSVSVTKSGYTSASKTCSATADQTAQLDATISSIEQIVNGNFEGGFMLSGTSMVAKNWKGVWNGSTLNGFWDSDTAGHPAYCQSITSNADGFEIGISQGITNLLPGSTFTFTAESKKSSTNNAVYIGVRSGTGYSDIGITGTAFTNTTGAWVSQSVSGTVDSSGSITVYLWVKRVSGTSSPVLFDNASLKVQ